MVEDDGGVRGLIAEVLGSAGYRVLATPNGAEALARLESDNPDLDLMIADLMLPGITGGELISRFAVLRPGTPVLSISGYPARAGTPAGGAPPHIAKPFTPDGLLAKVKEVLDRRV